MSVNTAKMIMPPQGVFVIWEWEWDDLSITSTVDHVSETSFEDSDSHINPDIKSDSDDVDSETPLADPELLAAASAQLPSKIHTVTFKCIGSTHDPAAQEALATVSKLLREGDVPVRLTPEPTNEVDARAIAFQCQIDKKWKRIGYVVKEALDSVHLAMEEQKIVRVKFAWAKYIVTWTRSRPGFFAGIDISIKGQWPPVVCRSASTR